MKKILNKRATKAGLVLASIDLIIISGPLISYCAIDSNRCGEEMRVGIFHWPLFLIVEPLILNYSTGFDALLIVIAGIVQYFFIGYGLILLIDYFKWRRG